MSIISACIADNHNRELKRKAAELAAAIKNHDWTRVREVQRWLDSEPYSE